MLFDIPLAIDMMEGTMTLAWGLQDYCEIPVDDEKSPLLRA
jgi:hypothetical protein